MATLSTPSSCLRSVIGTFLDLFLLELKTSASSTTTNTTITRTIIPAAAISVVVVKLVEAVPDDGETAIVLLIDKVGDMEGSVDIEGVGLVEEVEGSGVGSSTAGKGGREQRHE